MIKIKTAFILLFSFIVIFMLIILMAVLQLLQNRKEFGTSQISRHYAFVVSDSLRIYSSNLTRICTNYVLTGNSRLEAEYYKLHEGNNLTDSLSDKTILPYIYKLKDYGFTDKEVQLVKNVELALVKQKKEEQQAILSIKAVLANRSRSYFLSEASRKQALIFLEGDNYVKIKEEIVNSIQDFERLVEDRTQRIYQKDIKEGMMLFYSVLTLIVFVILISILSFYLIYRRVVQQEKLDAKFKEGVVQLEKTQKRLLQSDERFTLAVNNSGAYVWDYNVQTKELIWSPDDSELLGYKLSDIEPNIDFLLSHIHPNDKMAFENLFKEHLDNDTPFNIDARFYNKQNKIVWLKCKGSSSRDENNKANRVVGLFVDITDRVKEEEKVMNLILETEDKERSRIAREIHDSLQQIMSTALLNFEKVRMSVLFEDSEIKDKFDTGYQFLKESITESRALAHNLMPKVVDKNGVALAIESLINAIKGSASVNIEFHHNFGTDRLNLVAEMTIYRIVQEAVNNVIKYSEAKTCTIQLIKSQDLVTLTIEDDGVGFDLLKTDHTFGINSMKTRADAIGGFIEIESKPGRGTQILFELTV